MASLGHKSWASRVLVAIKLRAWFLQIPGKYYVRMEGGCRQGVVAQWQSTGGSSQKPWVRFPAAPLFLSRPWLCLELDTISIGLLPLEAGVPSIGLLHKLWFHLDSLYNLIQRTQLIKLWSSTIAQSKLIRAWKKDGCCQAVVAQWQCTGGSSQKPCGATFPFKTLPFKGLRTVRPRLCL